MLETSNRMYSRECSKGKLLQPIARLLTELPSMLVCQEEHSKA